MEKYMKQQSVKMFFLIISSSVFVSCSAGSYLNTTPQASIDFNGHLWKESTPTYTEWVDSGKLSCMTWIPNEDQIEDKKSFIQTSNDCSMEQTREKQNREINENNDYRNNGDPVIEKQLIMYQTDFRPAIGKKK